MIYSIDTNVFVDALRVPAELDQLKSFLAWALPTTVISSIVAAELTAGARTDRAVRALDTVLLAPFERRGRLVAPTASAWRRTGTLISRMGSVGLSASRQNDALLAAQSREAGWTLITRDRDFEMLRAHVGGLKIAAPFPQRP